MNFLTLINTQIKIINALDINDLFSNKNKEMVSLPLNLNSLGFREDLNNQYQEFNSPPISKITNIFIKTYKYNINKNDKIIERINIDNSQKIKTVNEKMKKETIEIIKNMNARIKKRIQEILKLTSIEIDEFINQITKNEINVISEKLGKKDFLLENFKIIYNLKTKQINNFLDQNSKDFESKTIKKMMKKNKYLNYRLSDILLPKKENYYNKYNKKNNFNLKYLNFENIYIDRFITDNILEIEKNIYNDLKKYVSESYKTLYDYKIVEINFSKIQINNATSKILEFSKTINEKFLSNVYDFIEEIKNEEYETIKKELTSNNYYITNNILSDECNKTDEYIDLASKNYYYEKTKIDNLIIERNLNMVKYMINEIK